MAATLVDLVPWFRIKAGLARTVRISASLLLLAILVILVVVPLAIVLYVSLTAGLPFSGASKIVWTIENYSALWSRPMLDASLTTLFVAGLGTAIATMIGSTLAWLAARTDIRFRAGVYLVGVMPLFVSLLVAAVTWSLLGAGRSGYLNIIFRSLGLPIEIQVQSLIGVGVVFGLYYAPYPFLFLHNALNLVHPEMEEASTLHGGSLAQTLRTVTFPLVKPALIGSMLLVSVLMVEDFPVPELLGGPVGIQTISIRIFDLMSRTPPQPNEASALSVLLIVGICILVYTQRRVLRGRDYRTVTGKGMQRRLVPLGWVQWPALVFVGLYAFISVGAPCLALLEGALRSDLYIANAAALFNISRFSLSHLSAAILDPEVRSSLANSLIAAGATAIFGTSFFFVLAYCAGRTKARFRQPIEYLAMVPIAVPALVMSLGILWTWVAVPLPIYGTLTILVIAFVTRFMPPGYRAISTSLGQIHDDLEDAALVSGASMLASVRTITLPLVRGGIAGAVFVLFILGMRELTAALFLYTTHTRLLSIVVFESYENGLWSVVASLSLIYTFVLIFATLLGRRWMRVDI
jgi:iron(III) transport system permease protein